MFGAFPRGSRTVRTAGWAAALVVLAVGAWSYGFEPERQFPDTTDGISRPRITWARRSR